MNIPIIESNAFSKWQSLEEPGCRERGEGAEGPRRLGSLCPWQLFGGPYRPSLVHRHRTASAGWMGPGINNGKLEFAGINGISPATMNTIGI